MTENTLFAETIEVNGKEYTITATTDDDTCTVVKKALDIEFRGSIEVYQTTPPEDYNSLPETYIQIFYNGTEFEYASDQLILTEDNYSVYVITKHANTLESLCKRVCKALFNRGFSIIDNGTNVESSDGDGYIGQVITVSFLR